MTSPGSTASAPSAQPPVVEVNGLTKSYGDHVVVNRFDMAVERGEIFGILGTNGAGKTTSVECAQGLRRADSGSVRVLGLDPIADRGKLSGRVGSQLQDSNLPDRMRVGEALQLFASGPAEVSRLMDEWDLESMAKKPFGGLSGGQRQRLFLALALVNEPEVVFLDELTQGLDPSARREVWKLIERVRDRGTTVVLVTHFMEEAEVLCDRVVVMRAGRAIDTGTPGELIERHSNGVRVRFASTAQDLAWLNEVSGVVHTSRQGSDVEVLGSSSMVAYLGAALVARGEVPESIRVHQPNLEDALLSILEPATQQRASTPPDLKAA